MRCTAKTIIYTLRTKVFIAKLVSVANLFRDNNKTFCHILFIYFTDAANSLSTHLKQTLSKAKNIRLI